MIPTKLILRNFIGIKSGMGRDELVLDLNALAGDAQLVAFVGANGDGKSTVLENLHPYRLMPSRAGSYSPSSFSFYDNVYGAEASKVLEFEHDGNYYRSTLVFKMSAKTKKSECYLHVSDGNDWHPARANNTVSDGKADTYDRVLEGILGTPEMFFVSVFAAQNRRSLVSYTNVEIKGLLSELLGLEHIRELGAKASDVVKSLRLKLDSMRGDLARISELESERDTTDAKLSGDKITLSMLAAGKTKARQEVQAATKRLSDINADLESKAETEKKRTELKARLNGVDQRVGSSLREIDTDIQEDARRTRAERESLAADIAHVEKQIRTAEAKVADCDAMLARRKHIDAAVKLVPALEQAERDSTVSVALARTNAETANKIQAEINGIRAQLTSIKNEGVTLTAGCESLKSRSILIEQVPCRGTDLQPRCPLLKEANTAKAGIPEATEKAEAKRAEYIAMQDNGKALETQLEGLTDAVLLFKQAEARHAEIVSQLRIASTTAALADGIAKTEADRYEAVDQVATLGDMLGKKKAAFTALDTDSLARAVDLRARMSIIKTEGEKERDTIQEQLAALPPPADLTAIKTAETALSTAETQQTQADTTYDEHAARVATQTERLRSIGESLERMATVRTNAETVEGEIHHWVSLTKALGNDGIIALSIDDAGPALAGLTNDLLMSCYGPRFSVNLRTQSQTGAGTTKEEFDIRVFDAERDEEKSLKDMSGGEKLWINECLTRSIALYLSQNSGRNYETLFADESDGALDPDRKQMFMSMKREVMRLGKYRREFFISHSPDVWELADAVIQFSQLKAQQ